MIDPRTHELLVDMARSADNLAAIMRNKYFEEKDFELCKRALAGMLVHLERIEHLEQGYAAQKTTIGPKLDQFLDEVEALVKGESTDG